MKFCVHSQDSCFVSFRSKDEVIHSQQLVRDSRHKIYQENVSQSIHSYTELSELEFPSPPDPPATVETSKFGVEYDLIPDHHQINEYPSSQNGCYSRIYSTKVAIYAVIYVNTATAVFSLSPKNLLNSFEWTLDTSCVCLRNQRLSVLYIYSVKLCNSLYAE